MPTFSSKTSVKIAFYVSNRATRLRRAIDRMIGKHDDLLSMVAFVFVDNVQNEDLRRSCTDSRIDLFEEDLTAISKSQKGIHVSDRLLKLLDTNGVSYLICFGDKILQGEILSEYENKMINFHPSLLPAFKGLHAIDKAMEEGAFLLGNSAHIIDKGVDTGPVIIQSLLHSSEYQTYDDLLNLQVPMLIQLMTWLKDKRLSFEKGRPHIKNASYAISRFIPNLEIDVH